MGQIKNIKLHIVTDIKDQNQSKRCRTMRTIEDNPVSNLLEENKLSRKVLEDLIEQVALLRVKKLENSKAPAVISENIVKMESIEPVEIDPSGVFKYILIQCNEDFLVRGFKWAEYHADIFDKVELDIHKKGATCKCV